MANGRARAGVTSWARSDVLLVASAGEGVEEACVQSRPMARRARLYAIMSLAGMRGLGEARVLGGEWRPVACGPEERGWCG
jgi:hypothetical protein